MIKIKKPKKFSGIKIKSLTMRIWVTFTAIILVIICCISFLYIFAYKKIVEKAKMNDLKVAHDILLTGNNFDKQNRMDEFGTLKGSNFFILKIGANNTYQIEDKKHDDANHNMDNAPIGTNNTINKMTPPPPMYDKVETKLWMASFIKDTNIHEKQFIETYHNQRMMFIISAVNTTDTTEKTYLISYMPDRNENDLLIPIIIIGALFIAIGFLTAKVVAGVIAKPLRDLENYTIRIAHKDWKEPIEVKSDDEIGRLAVSMNKMREELKHADEEEKMFLQSISHDLKTPVMVIMSHADAIIDGVYVDSVEKTAEIIKDEAISLEKKIKQLLYLNTLDYALQNSTENSRINLHDMLINIVSRFEMINSRVEWDLDIDELNIYGNDEKIQISIENIMDNGLRYAEEKMAVKLKRNGSFAEIEIYNDGPNIAEKHMNHIFENFYKDKTGNFGLGLTISKKIVDFYKGELKAVNREKGVSFIIKYPIYESNKSLDLD